VLGVKKDERIQMQDLFLFDRQGVTDAGKVQGRFRGSGATPRVLERLKVSGIKLPPAIFEETLAVNL
jgi:pilus assembly protein CpaF